MNTIRRATPLLLLVTVLTLVFSGSATATKLITGAQVKDGSVQARDIRNKTVTAQDVTDGSLQPQDLAVSAARLLPDDGPIGDEGPRGPQGPVGHAGVRGLRDLQYVASQGFSLPSGSRLDKFVPCPPGLKVLNGGLSSSGSDIGPALFNSSPASDGSSWHVYAGNDTAQSFTAYLWAVCATS